jgi:hypothetical protein
MPWFMLLVSLVYAVRPLLVPLAFVGGFVAAWVIL